MGGCAFSMLYAISSQCARICLLIQVYFSEVARLFSIPCQSPKERAHSSKVDCEITVNASESRLALESGFKAVIRTANLRIASGRATSQVSSCLGGSDFQPGL